MNKAKFLFTIATALVLSETVANAQNNDKVLLQTPDAAAARPNTDSASTWRARISNGNLTKESDQFTCRTPPGTYEFTLIGDRLLVTNSVNSRTEAAVQPDGSVRQAFVSNKTGKTLIVSGNARTKQLTITNGACTWNALPSP